MTNPKRLVSISFGSNELKSIDLGPAINQLKVSRDVLTNNEPINEREGRKGQADLERRNAKSYKWAMEILKNKKWWEKLIK